MAPPGNESKTYFFNDQSSWQRKAGRNEQMAVHGRGTDNLVCIGHLELKP